MTLRRSVCYGAKCVVGRLGVTLGLVGVLGAGACGSESAAGKGGGGAGGEVDAGADAPAADAPDETMPEAGEVEDGGGTGFDFGGFAVEWQPCSLYEGEDDGLAECAEVQMPLHWSSREGKTIGVAAKRLLAQGEAKRQLWLLHGGPGASGVIGWPSFMETMRQLDPDLDLYTLDHRGTGHTRRLSCPDQEAPESHDGQSISSFEMPACKEYLASEYGDELNALTATYSAVDLAAYVEATREPGKKVIVYGGSYGTYWAHRYLQVAPEQADGVVLAGIAPPDATFIRFDERANQVGEDFFAVCGQDPYCSSKLGPDPWSRLGEALEAMEQGHCSQLGIPRQYISLLFAYALYYYPINAAVPAILYRLSRCEPQDRAAITAFFDFNFGSGGVWDIASYSILLQHHVTFSEMWAHPDFDGVDLQSYFLDLYDNAYVAKHNGSSKLTLSLDWPVYHDPAFDDGVAVTDTPMLMLQGRLDPATTWYDAVAMKDLFSGAHQHFVEFPNATHGVLHATPTSEGDDPDHCGMRIFRAFLEEPEQDVDTSCVGDVLPIDFRGTPALAEALLGTSDLWENEAPSSGNTSMSAGVSPEGLALRERIRTSIRGGPQPPMHRMVLRR